MIRLKKETAAAILEAARLLLEQMTEVSRLPMLPAAPCGNQAKGWQTKAGRELDLSSMEGFIGPMRNMTPKGKGE